MLAWRQPTCISTHHTQYSQKHCSENCLVKQTISYKPITLLPGRASQSRTDKQRGITGWLMNTPSAYRRIWWKSSHFMRVTQQYVISGRRQHEPLSWTRTQFRQRTVSVAGPDIWNSLPPEIKLNENFATFTKKLKTHLFDIAFS